MTKPATKIEIYCEECGSVNITRDACASWDVLTQQWEFVDVYDYMSCADCGSECIEEREYHKRTAHPLHGLWDGNSAETLD